MARVMVLPDAEWRMRPGLVRLIDVLSDDGGAARFVGGAVRDTMLGLAVADVDIATPVLPEEVLARLAHAGIKAVPTGIAHGTVTAVSDGRPYEVTTLRRDMATDGRRATVAFAEDWRADAARRDFTFNALYADPASGEVFDWFGGLDDLAAGIVRFIGDPAQRIAEDHLRIMRYYRFAARFGRGALDAASHAAVVAARHTLRALSRERVADELMKLLALATPFDAVRQMAADEVLAEILPEADARAPDRLAKLLANETIIGAHPEAVRRMAALLPSPDTAETAAARLRLSRRMRERLGTLARMGEAGLAMPARHLAYRTDIATARDCWLLGGTDMDIADVDRALTGWVTPRFPIKGGMLVARGIDAGPDVARLLRQIEDRWVNEDFPDGAVLDTLVDQALAEFRQ